VQHLNYPEFFELHRIARRTLEQKQVIVNNLSFRRATFRLAKVHGLSDLREVLEETFGGNDFDGFELRSSAVARSHASSLGRDSVVHLAWARMASTQLIPAWSMSLDLPMPGSGRRGYLVVHKLHAQSALQVDINLLLQEFRTVLAQALNRALTAEGEERSRQNETLAATAHSGLQ